MSQTLRINAADQRISLLGKWTTTTDQALYCLSDCQFFLMFRGTGIKVYGTCPLNTVGTLRLELDGNSTDIHLDNTTCVGGVTSEYLVKNIEDGDHQLAGSALQTAGGNLFIQYFEIENSSGDAFDLLSAGPTAQNVPAQAAIVDNTDPTILYLNEDHWMEYPDVRDYRGSASYGFTQGARLSYFFDGVAIWFYGRLCIGCASFTISIDGSTPQRSTTSHGSDLSQQMIWSNTSLDPGRHNITLTHDDGPFVRFYFDFFRVLPGAGTSTLSSFSTTSSGELPATVLPVPPTNQNQTNRILLAVGLTIGLLVFAGVVLCGVCHIYRRRGRRPIDLNAHSVSPYAVPPIRRADQQSSIPQVRKGVSQPAQPSGSPMAADDPAMFPSVTGLGPPPSYATPIYDWRLDTAQ